MQATNYNQQAQDFLDKHGIKFRATLSDTKTPQWGDDGRHGHHYLVTLSKGKPCSGRYTGNIRSGARITFDFWSSIADMEAGIQAVTPHDVLACIYGDVNCPETFEDFCSEFGYESDSIKALQMFRRCSAFSKRLLAFFTTKEIEDLSEIQ